jgi:hypothetical protein
LGALNSSYAVYINVWISLLLAMIMLFIGHQYLYVLFETRYLDGRLY